MNSRKIFFTPGPSALYFTVEEHLRRGLQNQIPSISHRSPQFSSIYQQTQERLRELVGLPEDYRLFFTGSATEVWERMLQAAVTSTTLHLVNGAFSGRFLQIAGKLGYQAIGCEVAAGEAVSIQVLPDEADPELICVTHNETSTGVQQPLHGLTELRRKFPEALIAVDAVSSFPVVDLPFGLVDSVYFSVQKCFGLPAGLGGWLVNERFIEKARQIAPTGKTSYHGIDSFLSKYQKYQTPETPNVLYIYLLGQVIGDMLEKGMDRIRMESKYKSAILYHLLESRHTAAPFVTNKEWRSETVIVGATGENTIKIIEGLGNKGLVVGSGYGSFKNQHIRVANFPTHSKEQIEMLVDQLQTIID